MGQFLRVTALVRSWALLALTATAASAGPSPAPEWLKEARKFLPDGHVLGQVIAAIPDGAEATIAVFPASANDPESPGSVFEPAQVLDVLLQNDGDGAPP